MAEQFEIGAADGRGRGSRRPCSSCIRSRRGRTPPPPARKLPVPTFTLLTTLQASTVPAMSTLQLLANNPPPPCRVPVGSNRTPAEVRYARSDERTEAPAWMLTSASAAWMAPPPESVPFAVSCVSQSTMDEPPCMVNEARFEEEGDVVTPGGTVRVGC